jgi:biopolymer transport protein ExbD
MKKRTMPDMKEGNVNVTPLIDVVMCLIIFYMLVAKIGVSIGLDRAIDAPSAYLGVKINDLGNTLALNLYPKPGTDEPQVLVDINGERQKELKFQENRGGKLVHPIREVLQDLRKERGPGFKVIINADKNMKYAAMQLILQECTLAGTTNVNFAAREERRAVPG